MKFFKYHALGNDYIVIDPSKDGVPDTLSEPMIQRICHRHFGVGSDGILWGPIHHSREPISLRIFNPDGSEAEKSGNGLRIFSRYLWDQKLVGIDPFHLNTLGGKVTSQILDNGTRVMVDMGRVSFDSRLIPVEGEPREVINESLIAGNRTFQYSAATIGNPHCVILRDQISAEEAMTYGPIIETHSFFPHRTNVQFVEVVDSGTIKIEIWERGAGYTLASGSSASACAAVVHRLGQGRDHMKVVMPGGDLEIHIRDHYDIRMTGPVTRVAEGVVDKEMF